MAINKKKPAKHAGGRPTKYRREYCKQIIEYFDKPPQEPLRYEKTYYKDGTLKSETPIAAIATELPTFQGFAHSIRVDTETLKNWCETHPEFLGAYTRAKELQEKIWLVNAMSGQYNSGFAQFFGKNCLGYKEKFENEMSGGVKVEMSAEARAYAK